jgi:hypothetical protein
VHTIATSRRWAETNRAPILFPNIEQAKWIVWKTAPDRVSPFGSKALFYLCVASTGRGRAARPSATPLFLIFLDAYFQNIPFGGSFVSLNSRGLDGVSFQSSIQTDYAHIPVMVLYEVFGRCFEYSLTSAFIL